MVGTLMLIIMAIGFGVGIIQGINGIRKREAAKRQAREIATSTRVNTWHDMRKDNGNG